MTQVNKNLHTINNEDIITTTYCSYNTSSNSIKIYNNFRKSSKGTIRTNKNCGMYLGCIIAEQVLSHLFKNTERMSICNPGYDFICGKGYKIDCKSSCMIKGKYNPWKFDINRNKIADFFLCLAFDNRQDLNPLHIWLIPGNVVNNQFCASISESTLEKWSEYEQPLNKVLMCCNMMKGI